MKLLYVGEDREMARRASEALGDVVKDGQVVWARSFPAALGWLRDNTDAAAVVADADVQHESVTGFAARARSAGITVPLIVVAPPDSRTPEGPYEVVMKSAGLPSELADAIRRTVGPRVVQRREAETNAALDAVRAECDARLALAAAARDDLEEQLRDKIAALEEAESIRGAIEYRLTVLEAARKHAEQQLVIEQAAATHRQAELESRAVQETATRQLVERQLADAQAALEELERRHHTETAHAADTAAQRTLLEQQLTEARSALEQAETRRQAESAAAAKELTKRRAEFAAAIAELSRSRDAVARQLAEAAAALDSLRRGHAEEMAAAAEGVARRDSELHARLAQASDARDLLEKRLRDADAARLHGEQHASAQQSAAARRIADLETQLADASTSRSVFEQKLGEIEAALEEAEERHRARMAAAAAGFAEQQADYEARLTQAADARDAVTRQLRDATAALEATRAENAAQALAAAERLAARESELAAKLAEASAARASVEQRLADAEHARQANEQRAAAEREHAAAQRDEAAKQRADLEMRLAREVETGRSLEQQLAAARAAALETEQQSAERIAALERQMRDREGAFHAATAEAERQSAERIAALERQMRDRETELQEAAAHERAAHERSVAAKDEELAAAAASRGAVQRALDELRGELETVRSEFESIARVASEHAAEVATLGAVVIERDAQVRELMAERLAMQQAHQEALTDREHKLRAAQDASAREAAKLQAELAALGRDLELARVERDAVRDEAERVPDLTERLRQQHDQMRRQFEHTPYGVMRMGRDGRVTEVNRSLIRLLGYRTADEIRELDFAARVFESQSDLRWLIDRCLTTGAREVAEVTWKRRNGSRRIVRLLAFTAAPDTVEMIAQDVSALRAVEEQLRTAQRMEAVARLASEVAVTCGNLLRDVVEDGQRWLDSAGLSDIVRPQGEGLLREVTRAASFLRQLSVYGDQQTSAVEPVEVSQVLRAFAPVLGRVAGDQIQFALPKASRPLHVDVDVERVQRIFVNVASYARQRMPDGGRLKVELGRVEAERNLLAKHPNVRPGAHALITITEERAKAPAAVDPRSAAAGSPASKSSESPGLDLGVLLEIVGGCGGHLWMAAEPAGNMVLKIHLPLRVSDALADQTQAGTATRLVGDLINSFRPLRARS
jgi:PAS domain S-box-containing protein